jgi:hypothetical protein
MYTYLMQLCEHNTLLTMPIRIVVFCIFISYHLSLFDFFFLSHTLYFKKAMVLNRRDKLLRSILLLKTLFIFLGPKSFM